MAENLLASAYKSAVAANHASDVLDDKKVGTIRKAVDFVADTAGDALNVATLGASRRIANAFASEDKKLDYKGLKAAKREFAERGEDGGPMSIQARADALLGAADPEPEPDAGPDL